jgi:hypothetical protein
VENDTRKRAPSASPDPADDDRQGSPDPGRDPDDVDGEDADAGDVEDRPDEEPPDDDDEDWADDDDDPDGDDEADDDDDDEEADEDDADEEVGERRPAAGRRPAGGPRRKLLVQIGVFVVAGSIAAIYGINCYLNSVVAEEVGTHCLAEQQRLDQAILDATEDRLPALEWNLNLYRARRRYVREICDATGNQLTWWRWNLTRRIEVDISESTQQDISRTMARAAMSCQSEISLMEEALVREMATRESTDRVRGRVEEMVQGQLASCQELGAAVESSRPGFWPPLIASGTMDVTNQVLTLMPRSWQEVSSQMEEPR